MGEGEDGWTSAEVAGIIANPFSAITFDPGLFGEHEAIVDEETWVQVNVGLVEELGAEAYLRNLLVILKGDKPRA
jgi:hypothetical protein